MKKCTYCGKEYLDEATVCEIDAEPLVDPNAPKPPAKAARTSASDTKDKRPKMPDEGLGKFCIVAGCAMVILPLFLSRIDLGQRFSAAAIGFAGLSWGLKQVAGAKKWRENYGEPSPEELMETKKNHSVSWPIWILVALVLLGLVYAALTGAHRR